jgi:hypothetical protein
VALGDDNSHQQPAHRLRGRERMPEPLDAIVAADDQTRPERAFRLEA